MINRRFPCVYCGNEQCIEFYQEHAIVKCKECGKNIEVKIYFALSGRKASETKYLLYKDSVYNPVEVIVECYNNYYLDGKGNRFIANEIYSTLEAAKTQQKRNLQKRIREEKENVKHYKNELEKSSKKLELLESDLTND